MRFQLKAQFEEKEFEVLIDAEMNKKYGLIYAPGQVLEGVIGIDLALLSMNTEFWKIFSNPPHSLYPVERVPEGVRLRREYWTELDGKLSHFPRFRYNAFFQHKRPDYFVDARAKQWPFWEGPFYRFDLTAHQQRALELLDQISGDDALVAYSCPAFHESNVLQDCYVGETIVQNTNFVPAAQLSDHKQYTFVAGHQGGVACSEPASIEGLDLASDGQRRRSREDGRTNREVIEGMYKMVKEASVGAGLEPQIENLLTVFGRDIPPIARPFLTIAAFARLTNTSWLIGVEARLD